MNAEKSAGSPQGLNWGENVSPFNPALRGVEQARGELLPAVLR
jgi:hypothetical protein